MQFNKLVLSLLAVVSVYAGFGCPGDDKTCSDHCINYVCGENGRFNHIRLSGSHCGGVLGFTCVCDYNTNVRNESC